MMLIPNAMMKVDDKTIMSHFYESNFFTSRAGLVLLFSSWEEEDHVWLNHPPQPLQPPQPPQPP